jgi:mRNA-degrading endonuclease toxin of MazEF toxin-antitoxin module
MSDNRPHTNFRGGQIVVVDWRGDALPKEPNRLRPAVVIENPALFEPDYENVIVVPLTEDGDLIIRSLSLPILPTIENGCSKPCWAAAHLVTATSKQRVRATRSTVTTDQLTAIRQRVARAIGA